MVDLSSLHETLIRSIELWGKGQRAEALKVLDQSIASAEHNSQTAWIKPLCMQASLIAESMGELQLVTQYAERILSHEPEPLQKALALYTVADALFRQGEANLARRRAAESYAIVLRISSKEGRGLLELLTMRWPQIGDWER